MPKAALFYGGLTLAIAGAGIPLVLTQLPTSNVPQSIFSAGSFVIANQSWIVLAGILLVLISVFL